uniref:Putative ovule protein n=1 Tax=Solanum chacoense TaxID=4108 RepID=A0A0V0GSR8_SOLCH
MVAIPTASQERYCFFGIKCEGMGFLNRLRCIMNMVSAFNGKWVYSEWILLGLSAKVLGEKLICASATYWNVMQVFK